MDRRTVITLNTLTETEKLGKNLAKNLQPSDVLAFYGPIGSGKTTLIKAIITSLGFPRNQITSPTFIYLNIYPLLVPCYHFDLYRLTNEKQFYQKGFAEYLEHNGICFIEWAEKIPTTLPMNTKKIYLGYDQQGVRECTLL
jgi:tRNA threonylcarbamoyladenosine biosynthesis protein TsaE